MSHPPQTPAVLMASSKSKEPSLKLKELLSTKVTEQRVKTRDVDSESDKPRLQKPSEDENSPADKGKPHKTGKPKTSSAPPPIKAILMPSLRYPMSGIIEPDVSSYVPCAFQMYFIIHVMDDIMRKSFYFLRREDAWHPFLSRLYFGILFYIQIVRCELTTKTISPEHLEILQDFIDTNPLEKLFIPGPLVTLFKSLNVGKPAPGLIGSITPTIPTNLGVARASDLMEYDVAHASNLIVPNIPALLEFCNKIVTAPAANVPDFTDNTTFSTATDYTF